MSEQLTATPKKNCRACGFSYMEPDSGLICGHPDAGFFGVTIRTEPAAHCPDFVKFQQHPKRQANGDLRTA